MGFVRSFHSLHLRIALFLIAFSFSPISGLFSQSAEARQSQPSQQPAVLAGRVSDSSGAALQGVAVTVAATNPPGSQRTVITDRNGDYRVHDLAPGQYDISAELAGFRTARRSVSLTANAPAIDLTSDAGMLIFAGRKPGGLGNMGFVAVLVAPATGVVLGVVDADRSPAWAPLFLHRDLWAGQTGQVISAVMAIGTLLMLVIGLYLWWPPRGSFVRRLLGKPWRTLKQARPLHDWVGVWTLIVLCALVASGLALVRPAWVEPVLDAVAGAEPEETPPSASCGTPVTPVTPVTAGTPVAPVTPMTFDAAIARASALVPGSRFKSLYPVEAKSGRWELVLATEQSDARRDEAHVLVDRHCGDVTLEATPATRSGHETASMWLSDIHDGAAFGRGGPFVSLIGLTPLVLLWSGVVLWLRRPRRSSRPV